MRILNVFLLAGIVLIALACLIEPMCMETDTMAFKLKYVRLRAIHQEEWLDFQAKMTIADLQSRGIALRERLGREAEK